MRTPFVVAFPVAILLAFACYGQTHPVHAGPLHTDWTQIPIQNNSDVLDITLKPVEGMDWAVGITVKARAKNTISIGDAIRSRQFQRITGEPEAESGVTAHDPDRIALSGSTIAISGGAEHQVLAVYVEISEPRAVTVRDSTGLSNFAYVKDGIMIDNGIVLKRSISGQGEFVSHVMLGLNGIRRAFGWDAVGALGPAKIQ
jgi:hypothetical protein